VFKVKVGEGWICAIRSEILMIEPPLFTKRKASELVNQQAGAKSHNQIDSGHKAQG